MDEEVCVMGVLGTIVLSPVLSPLIWCAGGNSTIVLGGAVGLCAHSWWVTRAARQIGEEDFILSIDE